jgi:hypothetical protein
MKLTSMLDWNLKYIRQPEAICEQALEYALASSENKGVEILWDCPLIIFNLISLTLVLLRLNKENNHMVSNLRFYWCLQECKAKLSKKLVAACSATKEHSTMQTAKFCKE